MLIVEKVHHFIKRLKEVDSMDR